MCRYTCCSLYTNVILYKGLENLLNLGICQRSGNQSLGGQLYFIGEETALQTTSSQISVCLLSATVTV